MVAIAGLLAFGLVFLVIGADLLVRSASRLAGAFGIQPLVIGLTVVAFGTSAPELAVSLDAAVRGSADIAVGNVLGSNIFNVLLILGLCAVIAPLAVHARVVRIDAPLVLVVSLSSWWLASDGALGRGEGALLFAGIIAYTLFQVRARRGATPRPKESANRPSASVIDGAFLIAGLALLVLGARWLVSGATDVARLGGLSERVIGLTVVACGTSMPELATSLVAALRGERDIAVGNVVGSSLFNLLCVLGGAALISPAPIPVSAQALAFDFPVMAVVSLACLPVFFSGHLIARWEGALFLCYYAAYTTWLVLDARGSTALPGLRTAMLTCALPLTLIALTVSCWRWIRRPRTGMH